MAQTRTEYALIDDGEIAAEQPITESLMTRLRDQWFGALCDSTTTADSDERVSLPLRAKTTEMNTAKVLKPDGTGGVEWDDAAGGFLYFESRRGGNDGGGGVVQFPTGVISDSDFSYGGGVWTWNGGVSRKFLVVGSGNFEIDNAGTTCVLQLQINTGSGWVTLIQTECKEDTIGDKIPWALSTAVTLSDGDQVRVLNAAANNDVQNGTLSFIS